MAKNSIRDYSATNSDNTDIQSIDIGEGCSPAGINNAIREVMADLKDVSTGTIALESPKFDSILDGNIKATDASGTDAAGTATTIKGGAGTGTGDGGSIVFQVADGAGSTGSSVNAHATAMTIADDSGITVAGDLTVDTDTLHVDSTNNRVGIGTTSPESILHIESADPNIRLADTAAPAGTYNVVSGNGASGTLVFGADEGNTADSSHIQFKIDGTEYMRLNASGNLGIGNAAPAGLFEVGNVSISGSDGQAGFSVTSIGQVYYSTSNANCMFMNDTSSSAGTHNYILFRYQGSAIGDIDTTNNSTIRYNTFTGGHWTQFSDYLQPTIKAGTVMSAINEMCKWTAFEYTDSEGETQKTDMAGTYEIGTTHTIYIDEDGAQAQGTAISHDTSERVVKSKISDTAGDRSVYGVFAGHYKDGDSSVESLGLGIIRIGSGVTVANGDLLESAGDGTARPQTGNTADLFKSSTIAKVTSTVVGETYDDGSYTVPCTLHCG